MTGLRHSPLGDVHVALGAKMVPFSGWEMPLSYPGGTLAEHLACRNESVVFDVSHLGTVRVSGAGAFDAIQWAFTNDLNRIGEGRAQYTHLLDPADASVLDDIIVWWVDNERFEVMPNASNTSRVNKALRDAPTLPRIEDVTSDRAVVAVQGPKTRERLARVSPEAAAVGRFRVARTEIAGCEATVAGTGYTGEDGVEIAVDAQAATAVWDLIGSAGITPAGLGARDTLRLEAGLPLHGHELGAGISPLQAGLGWVVRFDKGDFRGREALLAEQQAGPSRLLQGLLVEGRRPPREGQTVWRDGTEIGVISSGNFSPIRQRGIALAFLHPDIAPGDEVTIDVRGSEVPAVVTSVPFV
ncbi:MAG: glycine cleavage system aminomethyltransferase GcvT [Acidimicrobiaceae bacterium]|nr:glycine cleavage system aminomethyltransferase GcvT [Acidimicrobiia bacterium]MCY4492271.1 glycine cleavage system aminomethyltransferase GcvT [Acidimicrobiaceae bacterium]